MYVRGYLQGSENGRVVTIAFYTPLKGNNSCKVYNFRIKIGNVQMVYSYFKNQLRSLHIVFNFIKFSSIMIINPGCPLLSKCIP
jgi:hypothetical protein